jgi:hypothetical protein
MNVLSFHWLVSNRASGFSRAFYELLLITRNNHRQQQQQQKKQLAAQKLG